MLKDKTILITGGTGSFGKFFSEYLIKNFSFKKLIIFSRDELKQFEMKDEKHFKNNKKIRFFLGDIRDVDRLNFAFRDVDIVIHAAALKQILSAEYNPFETIKTNVIGSQNIVQAAINQKVERVIALSTDKACSPLNLYGASKLCSEKIFINANYYKGNQKIKFSVLRYGNVNGSRGSVIPLFLKKKNLNQSLPVTDINMTRFSIKMEEAIEMVFWGLKNFQGGEILIPKVKSFKVIDLVKALNSKYFVTGIRIGEKLHEDLFSESESLNVIELKKYYILGQSRNKLISKYKNHNPKIFKKPFNYSSLNNKSYLKIDEIKKIFKDLS